MNTRTIHLAITRAATLGAAATMTALVLASQLGLAGHYTAEADAVLAAKRAAPVALNTTVAAPTQQTA